MSFCQIVVGSFQSFGHVKLICKLMNSPKCFHKFLFFFSYCRTITAEFGSFVRIDFRDMFRIEPANNEGSCEYDYLEIRDGDQGYAPLIGKLNLHWSLK